MICPECGGKNAGVIDNSFNTETNELYRKRRCKDCRYEFYTIESEVIATNQFKNTFYNNSRYVKNGVKQAAKRKEERRVAKEKNKRRMVKC